MKNIKFAGIILVLIFAGYLVYQSVQKNDNNIISGTKKEPITVFIAKDQKDTLDLKIKSFFKKENQEYKEVENRENAEIQISSNTPQMKFNEEIATFYSSKYSKISSSVYEAKQSKIYLGYNKSNKTIKELSAYLKSELKNENWSLIATGDIMLARHVGKKMFDAGNWNLPFLKTSEYLKNANLTISNLESPFSEGGQKIFEGMVFGADPKAVSGLKYAGIDIVSLANNHFGNQYQSGMIYTLNYLKQNGIKTIGAGENITKAHKPQIVEIKGQKVAFLAYDGVDSTPETYWADSTYAGLARWDLPQVKIDIKNAKKQADMVIVSIHAGNEYQYIPRLDVQDFAHQTLDAGADLIIGHHPHSNQIIENYKGKMIFYSLGNFVFDQMWSEQTKEGLVVKLDLVGKKVIKFELKPVYIENFNQPRFCSNSETDRILSHILPDSKI